MAVEDPTEKGGRLPARVVLTKAAAEPGRLQRIATDAAEAALVMKTMRDAGVMGPQEDVQSQNSKVTEKYGLDVGTIVKSQNDLLGTVLTQLTTMSGKAQDAQSKAELGKLETQVQELVKALNSQPADPLKTLRDSHEFLESLTASFQKKAAPTTPGLEQAGLAALPIYLQMEQMKLDAQERQRDHEIHMAELRRHWVKEDRLLGQQFTLEREKFDWEQKNAGKKADQLSAILGALAQGVDLQTLLKGGGGQVGGRVPPMASQPEPQAAAGVRPKAFECGTCGQTVTGYSQEDTNAQCPTCGQFYDLGQFDPPPAAAPEAPMSSVASQAP